MRCKICGYETDKPFSVCPYCGDRPTLESQNFSNRQGSRLSQNQLDHNITNQNTFNQNSVNGNTFSYDTNITKHFKGIGSSFEITQSELVISRFLNGGDFAILGTTAVVVLIISLCLCSIVFNLVDMIFWIIVICSVSGFNPLLYSTVRVNSRGIFVKTLFKEYVIPMEKIYSCDYKTVTRSKGRYKENFFSVFIKMKDASIFNKLEIDTGLCYKEIAPVTYLADKFNKYLGLTVCDE